MQTANNTINMLNIFFMVLPPNLWLKLLGLTVSDMAEIASVSPRTVEGWEQERQMSDSAIQLIKRYLMI
jgi:hypothetical protein